MWVLQQSQRVIQLTHHESSRVKAYARDILLCFLTGSCVKVLRTNLLFTNVNHFLSPNVKLGTYALSWPRISWMLLVRHVLYYEKTMKKIVQRKSTLEPMNVLLLFYSQCSRVESQTPLVFWEAFFIIGFMMLSFLWVLIDQLQLLWNWFN